MNQQDPPLLEHYKPPGLIFALCGANQSWSLAGSLLLVYDSAPLLVATDTRFSRCISRF